jgi:hypothetical protein
VTRWHERQVLSFSLASRTCIRQGATLFRSVDLDLPLRAPAQPRDTSELLRLPGSRNAVAAAPSGLGPWGLPKEAPPRTGFRKIVVVQMVTVDEAGQGPHPSPAAPDHLGPRRLRRGTTTKIDLDRGLQHPAAGTPMALAGRLEPGGSRAETATVNAVVSRR